MTVDDLARDKGLAADFLQSLGLEDREDGVFVPYYRENGSLARRSRLRTALAASEGSIWLFGKGKPVPYGLDRLPAAREAGYLILVEGESDCWTLWHHGLPALGIPGASMTKLIEREHLVGISRIYVCQEPGQGGATFVNGVARRLQIVAWTGQAAMFTCGDFKDPNALHRSDPAQFPSSFQQALDIATPLEVTGAHGSETAPDIDEIIRSAGLHQLTAESTPDELDAALRRLTEAARGGDQILRAVVRTAAIRVLKDLKIGPPAKLIDAALRITDDDSTVVASPGFLVDPDPADEPVDGISLLASLEETFARYVALVDGAAVALALWVVHTYTISAAYISPILALTSPQKRCGKTTVLILLRTLTRKALPAANITPAALFRTVEHYTPTILIDEADTFLNKNDELRGIINSGHTRSTAMVVRTVGDDHEPRTFSTWAPKAIAKIGPLPSTIEDRSILVPMRRKAPGERTERVRQERLDAEMGELRSWLARWANDHVEELRAADPDVPAELHDRAQDNWRPLLAIADAVGGDWPRLARAAALALHDAAADDDSGAAVQLLTDLKQLFDDRDTAQLSSKSIVDALVEMEDRPWPEWRKGRPITAPGVARLLKPFRIRPRTIRTGDSTAKGYLRGAFDDAFARYLPTEPSHRNKSGISSESADSEPSQTDPCYGSQSGEKDGDSDLVTAVTGREGGSEEDQEEFDL